MARSRKTQRQGIISSAVLGLVLCLPLPAHTASASDDAMSCIRLGEAVAIPSDYQTVEYDYMSVSNSCSQPVLYAHGQENGSREGMMGRSPIAANNSAGRLPIVGEFLRGEKPRVRILAACYAATHLLVWHDNRYRCVDKNAAVEESEGWQEALTEAEELSEAALRGEQTQLTAEEAEEAWRDIRAIDEAEAERAWQEALDEEAERAWQEALDEESERAWQEALAEEERKEEEAERQRVEEERRIAAEQERERQRVEEQRVAEQGQDCSYLGKRITDFLGSQPSNRSLSDEFCSVAIGIKMGIEYTLAGCLAASGATDAQVKQQLAHYRTQYKNVVDGYHEIVTDQARGGCAVKMKKYGYDM